MMHHQWSQFVECHVSRSVQHVRMSAAALPVRINGGRRGRGQRKAGYPAAISDGSFLFSAQTKTSTSSSSKREEKNITAQLIDSSTLNFFLFSLPAALHCAVLLARAATEYYSWPFWSRPNTCNSQRGQHLNPQQLPCMLSRPIQPTCHY